MQEEVTQKTIALSVNVGKGAARLTEQALQKAIKKFLEQKSKAPLEAGRDNAVICTYLKLLYKQDSSKAPCVYLR